MAHYQRCTNCIHSKSSLWTCRSCLLETVFLNFVDEIGLDFILCWIFYAFFVGVIPLNHLYRLNKDDEDKATLNLLVIKLSDLTLHVTNASNDNLC